MITPRYRTLIPYLIVLLSTTLILSLAANFPIQIDEDVAFQLKSIQQFLSGEADRFNSVVVPDPQDLSRDIQAWIVWWAPGISIFFLPLIAIGIPLGIACRLTMYILFVSGCIGWLKVADKLKVSFATKVITAISLPPYLLASANIRVLMSGDVLPFGFTSWLFLYALDINSRFQSENGRYRNTLIHTVIFGTLLGLVYWLKYSAFLVSISIFSYLVIILLLKSKYPFNKRLVLLGSLTISLLFPVVILAIINKSFSGVYSATDQFTSFINSSGVDKSKLAEVTATSLGTLIFCALGFPGLALFQLNLSVLISTVYRFFILQIINISLILPFSLLPVIGVNEVAILSSFIGIPGTLSILWGLRYSTRFIRKDIVLFCALTTFIPIVFLAYLSSKVGYNYLINDRIRYAMPFFPFTQILLVSAFINFIDNQAQGKIQENSLNLLNQNFATVIKNNIPKLVAMIAAVILFICPNYYILSEFKDWFANRVATTYITAKNQIYHVTLSDKNAEDTVTLINSTIKSDKDVIFLALYKFDKINGGRVNGAWLEIEQRSLPLTPLSGPLSLTHGVDGNNIDGSTAYSTLQDLRVILVVSGRSEGAVLKKLKGRFPQSTGWHEVKTSENDLVSIWYSDLRS
jgi:hypothetical protein